MQKKQRSPNEIGFDESFYTMEGMQSAPYSFFRNGYLTTKEEDITMWKVGNYTKEKGISIMRGSLHSSDIAILRYQRQLTILPNK